MTSVKLFARMYFRCCTENLAIALVASRLLELPIFCMEDADVSADTHKVLAILH